MKAMRSTLKRSSAARTASRSLGYFDDKFEIKQSEGSTPDRIVLGANVQEKPTGQLELSGGYSSLERFVVQLGISQNNFMGKGQSLDAQVNWSLYSKSIEAGFTDPYFLDKPILFGGQLFRRDYNSFNYVGNNRNTTYSELSTGGALRLGFPLSEYWNLGTRYQLSNDNISLDKSTFYTLNPATGQLECDPLKAGSYLCEEVGKKLTSLVGGSTVYDDTDGIHRTRGQQLTFTQDFAGLGGDIHYLRSAAYATKYKSFGNWILSLHGEGGFIDSLTRRPISSRILCGSPIASSTRTSAALTSEELALASFEFPTIPTGPSNSSTSTRTITRRSEAGPSILDVSSSSLLSAPRSRTTA